MDQTAQLRSLAEEMRQMANDLAGKADLNERIAALNLAAEFDVLADQARAAAARASSRRFRSIRSSASAIYATNA